MVEQEAPLRALIAAANTLEEQGQLQGRGGGAAGVRGLGEVGRLGWWAGCVKKGVFGWDWDCFVYVHISERGV